MKLAVHRARRQFKKTDRAIKVGRLVRLGGPQPFVIFCATLGLRSGIFPNRDHFHQGAGVLFRRSGAFRAIVPPA